MILTCPNCATRYMIDPVKLGGRGRLVRCGKCSHIWHQNPSEDVPRRLDSLPQLIKPKPIPPGANLSAIPPEPRRRSGALGWITLVLAVAAVLGGGWFERERIVQAWPPVLELYRMIGLMPSPVGDGLKVRNVTTKRVVEGGMQTLTVEGEVVNDSDKTRDVPPLRVMLSGARRHDLRHWTFKADESKLLPGEVAKFSTTIQNPPSEATDLAVDFGADEKG